MGGEEGGRESSTARCLCQLPLAEKHRLQSKTGTGREDAKGKPRGAAEAKRMCGELPDFAD